MTATNPVTPENVPSPQAAINAPGATAANPAPSSSTIVTSMADLKEKAPEVYRAIAEGIAMNICKESRRHAEELKKLMREERRNREHA